MAGYLSTKMKRKDLEDVYDDFSDFSLSSPARKIRRLDAELPPIMEEEEAGVSMNLNSFSQGDELEMPNFVAEIGPELQPETSLPVNEERALVLYKPVNSPLGNISTSSDVQITVNQDLISGLRNGVFWPARSDFIKLEDQSESKKEDPKGNSCLAVVPWVSYQLPCAPAVDTPPVADLSEPMEAEDVGYGTMEVEDDASATTPVDQTGGTNGSGEILQQWQQQHCMTPQLPPNTAATPVMWSW